MSNLLALRDSDVAVAIRRERQIAVLRRVEPQARLVAIVEELVPATSSRRSVYRSAKSRVWEPVELAWRGGSTPRIASTPETYEGLVVIKREILPDGRHKLIVKDPASGDFSDRIVAGA